MDSALHLYALYIFRRERLIFLATRGALLGAKKRSGERKITIEENPMTSIPVEGASITQPSTSSISAQFAGKVLRAIFLICLIIVTLRVALPQSETIWTIYDEPGDVVRFGLGLGVCVWIGVHLFKLPQGSQAFQTWLHFGLAGVPFGILCSVFLWWNHLHTWWHLLHG
jgi:hypothetical protein